MKTFVDYYKELPLCDNGFITVGCEEFKQIQLDAIKEGMTRAVCLNQENLGKDNYDLCKAILTTRDDLKEL